jgi:membrane-bound ClpP family serine protease
MEDKMSDRLIMAIVSTVLEEVAIAVIVLLGLPKLGIEINLPIIAGLVTFMVAWVAYAVITYRIGSRALSKKAVAGLPSMIDSKGKVVSPLAPEGLIRIKGELWKAKSVSTTIDVGEEVMVVGQDGLTLLVRKSNISEETN